MKTAMLITVLIGFVISIHAQEKLSNTSQKIGLPRASLREKGGELSKVRERTLSGSELKARQEVASAERARMLSARQRVNEGKSTILDLQQSRERTGSATLTPEENASRIARIEARKKDIEQREKAKASQLGVQPPSVSPRGSLRQPGVSALGARKAH